MTNADRFLPVFEHREVHSASIDAPCERAWDALHAVRANDIPLTSALMFVRMLPSMLTARGSRPGSTPLLTSVRTLACVLDERPPNHLALGLAGRFYRLAGNRPQPFSGPDAFDAFDEPGQIKAVWTFDLTPAGDGCRIVTETRTHATDAHAQRRFDVYWRLISWGSALIRIELLRAVKRRAEHG